MSEWALKRFWTETSVGEDADGFAVLLDGRAVKTPGKVKLRLPTRALADAVAAEWDAQEDKVDPATMPFTRMANSAMEKVTQQRAEVAAMLAGYGESDLICYRADHPDTLVARQAAAWDPLLDWADRTYGARLRPVTGVMYRPQDAGALARLRAPVEAMTPFALAAFHDLVALSGSLVIGLAATRGHGTLDSLWEMSRIDETWQSEQWGVDEEAAEMAARKRADFLHAGRVWALLHGI